jgi:hypothetical protein
VSEDTTSVMAGRLHLDGELVMRPEPFIKIEERGL